MRTTVTHFAILALLALSSSAQFDKAMAGSWSNLFAAPPDGSGFTNSEDVWIYTLAEWNGGLIAGGQFDHAGDQALDNLARLNTDGDGWWSVGGGANGVVFALGEFEGDLIVGGDFTEVGGLPIAYLARWNGSQWSGFGDGVNAAVSAIAVYEGDLIVGGYFTEAGSSSAPHIARWDGSTWNSMGVVETRVEDLIVFGSSLIACGLFNDVDGIPGTRHIARWSNGTWSSVGGGLNGRARSMAIYSGELIVGGEFDDAGATAVSNLATWNGGTWSSFGGGSTGEVRTLGTYNGDLVVGGYVSELGGAPTSFIGGWDGTNWYSMNAGTDGVVFTVLANGTHLFAGGQFDNAGNWASSAIGRWTDPAIGGCCFRDNDQHCFVSTYQECNAAIGDYTGDGTSCRECLGACCSFTISACLLTEAVDCELGTFSFGETCVTAGCEGACCEPDGYCSLEFEAMCDLIGGDWLYNTTCDPNPCTVSGVAASPVSSHRLLMEPTPNPASARTATRLVLSEPVVVHLDIYDSTGRRIRSLVDAAMSPGSHIVTWDGVKDSGEPAVAGAYYFLVEAGDETDARSFVLLR